MRNQSFHPAFFVNLPRPLRLRHLPGLAAAVLLSLPASPLPAQEFELTLDPAQSQVGFTLKAVLHTVHGTFRLTGGTVRFDPATGKADGTVVVDATSGNSGNESRDRKMHKEILESGKYPEITLTPVEISGHLDSQGESQVELRGIIRLHGSDHEMVIPMSVRISGNRLTVDGRFVIPYVEWGLRNPSTFLLRVDDRVEVEIHAVGRVSSPQGQ